MTWINHPFAPPDLCLGHIKSVFPASVSILMDFTSSSILNYDWYGEHLLPSYDVTCGYDQHTPKYADLPSFPHFVWSAIPPKTVIAQFQGLFQILKFSNLGHSKLRFQLHLDSNYFQIPTTFKFQLLSNLDYSQTSTTLQKGHYFQRSGKISPSREQALELK